MTANPIYTQVLKTLRRRVTEALKCSDSEIVDLTLAELLSTLFLLHGTYGSLGDFNTTFFALKKLVGDLMWAETGKAEQDVPVVIQ
jgi:hypothetical protein